MFGMQYHRSKHTVNVLATQARSPAKCCRGSSWQGHRTSFLFAIVLFDTSNIESRFHVTTYASSVFRSIHVVRQSTYVLLHVEGYCIIPFSLIPFSLYFGL